MSKRFGLEIKRARKGAGLTQEQAAEALSVSVRTYAKYEGGEILPGDDMVAAMMKIFDNPCLAGIGSRPADSAENRKTARRSGRGHAVSCSIGGSQQRFNEAGKNLL